MPDLPLHIGKNLPGINLIPVPVQVLGRDAKLDHEVGGQILRLDLAALFPPEPEEGGFIIAHDDPGVRAADETATLRTPVGLSPTRNRFLRHGAPH
jgi:hypothetical protein